LTDLSTLVKSQAQERLIVEGCIATDLKVHSKHNCFLLSDEQMEQIQQQAVSTTLEPGTNIVKIARGEFNYQAASGQQGEPLVLMWIYGGKFVNKKTNVEVSSTWSSLNGYDESLVLDVFEPTKLCAFFIDTHLDDNDGEVTLAVVRV
jgi:hypothetical protein